MTEYEIFRWDVVMSSNNLVKAPMIYIKPDMMFLEFARSNNFVIACEISGTGTVYDGKTIIGVVDKSYYVPNYRPNFYEKTGFYVVTLWANWYGYPEPGKLGMVKFSGMKNVPDNNYDKYVKPSVFTKSSSPYKINNDDKSKNGLNKNKIFIIIGITITLLIMLFTLDKILRK